MQSSSDGSADYVLVLQGFRIVRELHEIQQGVLGKHQVERYVLGLLLKFVDLIAHLSGDSQEHPQTILRETVDDLLEIGANWVVGHELINNLEPNIIANLFECLIGFLKIFCIPNYLGDDGPVR